MTSAAEEHGLLGQEQFGFRRGRSTLDAVFVLTTLMMKAKNKRWPYTVAFLDISKVNTPKLTINPLQILFKLQAYDNVWREALFTKLSNIGFGGKTLSLLRSMYMNDSIRFLINGNYTNELWLTQGVKQGKNRTEKCWNKF